MLGGTQLIQGRVQTVRQTFQHAQSSRRKLCIVRHPTHFDPRPKDSSDIALFVLTHLLQAEPDSRRNSRHSLEGATPPSLQTSMRWVSPSPTPTTRIAGPTPDVAIHSSFGVSSGAGTGTGSGSAATWDAESDQDSPVDPRKVGDLCCRYSCRN